MASEEWQPVVGYEDLYAVSDRGRVMNVAKRRGTRPGRLLGVWPTKDGYPAVTLVKAGKGRRRILAHLVAEAFVGPRPSGWEVNHENGNKDDSSPSNLTYVTRAEQMSHASRTGLLPSHAGERNPRAKLRERDVQQIRASNEPTAVLARAFGVSYFTIWDVRKGTTWRHLPMPARPR